MIEELLKQDYFQLFLLPQNFDINLQILQNTYRELQKKYHPDRFANLSELEINQALMLSSQINNAYNTLLNPLSRAIYLLQLRGVKMDLARETSLSPDFLLKQLELREQVADAVAAHDTDALEQLEQNLDHESRQLVAQISSLFLAGSNQELIELIKKLAFYDKLQQMLDNSFEEF